MASVDLGKEDKHPFRVWGKGADCQPRHLLSLVQYSSFSRNPQMCCAALAKLLGISVLQLPPL